MAIFLNTGSGTYVFDGVIVRGRATGQIPNPNLKWEEAKKLDIGLDMNMFNNKLTLVADYFIDTTDLLISNLFQEYLVVKLLELQILLMQEQFETESSFLQTLVISFQTILICL
jgi:hypothetical protein